MIKFLLLLFLFQGQAYKDFDQDAKKAFAEENYTTAFQLFQEAYRLQPKAQNYRVEGNYTDTYLPLFSMAQCQEHLDIIRAEELAEQSKIALEEEVLKKDRKARANYFLVIQRISKAAQEERTRRENAFRQQLSQAEQLLRKHQFKAARSAYEKLAKAYPKKTEALSGLQSVNFAEDQFFESKVQMLQFALKSKQVSSCESVLSELQKTFPNRDLSSYQQQIEALKKANAAETIQVIAQGDDSKNPRHGVQKNENPTPTQKESHTATSQSQANTKALAENQNRMLTRQHLLDTLSYFKRSGNPDQALEKLNNSCPEGGDGFASFHWIKALLLSFSYDQSGKQTTLAACRTEIRSVLSSGLQPNLNRRNYPATFLTLYKEVKEEITQ